MSSSKAGVGTSTTASLVSEAGDGSICPPSVGEGGGLIGRARELHGGGDLDAAAEAYREVLATSSEKHDALVGLGQIAAQCGDLVGGIRLIGRAIGEDGSRASTYLTLAEMFHIASQPVEAIQAVEMALAIEPGNLRGHCLAANANERLNRFDKVAESINAALAVDRESADANLILARLQKRKGEFGEAAEILSRLAKRSDLERFVRQTTFHELGMVLDRLGRYGEAFTAFERSSEAKAADPAAARIDPNLFQECIANYRPPEVGPRQLSPVASVEERRAENAVSEREVVGAVDNESSRSWDLGFIVGFPRSGTTLTEQFLAAHPKVITSDERPLMGMVTDELGAMAGDIDTTDFPGALGKLRQGQVERLRELYLDAAESVAGSELEGKLFVDKLPLNIIHVALINVLFPGAKVIVVLRDPRDVCLSCFMQNFRLNAAMINFLTLESTADFYADVMDLWLHQRDAITLDWKEIRYGEMVDDPEGSARSLLEFLSLDWDAQVLRFQERTRKKVISTPSAAAVTEPIHKRAAQRWRNYGRQIEPIRGRLERFVRAFGYEKC